MPNKPKMARDYTLRREGYVTPILCKECESSRLILRNLNSQYMECPACYRKASRYGIICGKCQNSMHLKNPRLLVCTYCNREIQLKEKDMIMEGGII